MTSIKQNSCSGIDCNQAMDAAYKAQHGTDPSTPTKGACCYEIKALTGFVDVNPAN